ncbi:MAG: WYL domain-containing transcriptional regulator [Ruminococcaceae bacterium]|nr:WYL domain-containing transcriptional regulator [Oscillospiraceae bacterium]
MPKSKGQQLKEIAILDILKTYSDEENPVSAGTIIEKLAEKGIEVERKAVYRGIDALIDYGSDILFTRTPKAGYYLLDKLFELPEIYLLTDAVQAASFITVKKTRDLVKKLDSMLSEGERRKREKGLYIDNGHKCENEEIFYNIDILSRAINENKKVCLTYTVRKISKDRKIINENREYKISPYALIWQNEHYYLVANNEKYDNLMHIRLDRARKINIIKENVRHFSEVSIYKDKFDVADYAAKSFQMYSGKSTKIELKCKEEILEQVVDRFSDKIFIRNLEDGWFTFSTNVNLSAGLVNWIMQFADSIVVKSPEELTDMLKARTEAIRSMYE